MYEEGYSRGLQKVEISSGPKDAPNDYKSIDIDVRGYNMLVSIQ